MRRIVVPAVAALILSSGSAVTSGAECALKEEAPFVIDGLSNFSKPKYRKELSGLACGPGSGEAGLAACLLVQDEGLEFAAGVLENRRLSLRIIGQLSAASPEDEFDAEAAAAYDGEFFVTGSHGRKAKSCENNAAARQVVRIRLDAEGQLQDSAVAMPGLATILQSLPATEQFYDQCLGTRDPDDKKGDWTPAKGVNIEGLAAKDGRLYFGLRGPVENGQAVVVSTAIDALFGGDGTASAPEVHFLDLGSNQGIRDMAAIADGFLILSGSQDDDDGAPAVFRWPGGSTPAEKICDIPPGQAGDHPEALAVLPVIAGGMHVLLLSDGPKGGAPVEIVLPP